MYKKSQVSLFVIIGIVIIALGALAIHFNSLSKEKIKTELVDINPKILPVKTFVETCLKNTLKEGADYLGIQGGYYIVPSKSVYMDGLIDIPYYVDYEDGNLAPTIDVLKTQLEFYISDLIRFCVGNFSALSVIGLSVSEKNGVSADITLSKDEISAKLKFPLEVNIGDSVTEVSDFIAQIDHPFLRLYSIALEATSLIEKDMEVIPTSDIIDLAVNRGVYFFIIDNMNGDVIYSIIDNYNTTDEKFFNFAARYLITRETFETERLPQIKDIPQLEKEPGYEFTYQVEADGENVIFSDYTSLFDITPDGLINFTPQISDKGKHIIMIKATDANGKEDYAFMELNILHDNPPTIDDIPDQTITKGTDFVFQVNATDPDNDPLFYTISGPPNIVVLPTTGQIIYQAAEVLESQVNVTVVDINGNVATESFILRVVE